MLEAANCNCYAFASIGSANCWGKCQLAGKALPICVRGCAKDLTAEKNECKRTYQNYKQNGGGLDWVVEMGVKTGKLC